MVVNVVLDEEEYEVVNKYLVESHSEENGFTFEQVDGCDCFNTTEDGYISLLEGLNMIFEDDLSNILTEDEIKILINLQKELKKLK